MTMKPAAAIENTATDDKLQANASDRSEPVKPEAVAQQAQQSQASEPPQPNRSPQRRPLFGN
jgi:hypothetical protein